jgi:shikimate dehydrogenase
MNRPYAEVIGDPISHSKSPLIHNFWLAKLGIDAEYRACHVRAEQLADYFGQRREDAVWRGCNVTMPHKLAALSFVDSQDESAEKAGAANTMVRTDGKIAAYNTDIEGVAGPLKDQRIENYPNMVAVYANIIGAGGAARAAVLGLLAAKACSDIDVFARDPKRAESFATWAGTPFGEAQSLDALDGPTWGCDPAFPDVKPNSGPDQHYSYVIVNASPLGMSGKPPLKINLNNYPPDTIVFDMVYDPTETDLLKAAKARGLRTIDGLQMLVGQAAAAFELFFGQPAPREHDAELRALLTS